MLALYQALLETAANSCYNITVEVISLRIEYLHFFLDVADTLSISKSAKRYYITPQGLSRAILTLEKELDNELFYRNGNSLVLSRAGQALLGPAREIVRGYESLMGEAQKQAFLSNPDGKPEIILHSSSFTLNKLSDLFNKLLSANFPSVRIRIMESTHEQILKAAYTPRNNFLYFVNMPSYDMDEILSRNDICYQPLLNLKILVMAAKKSPFAKKKEYTRQSLIEIPIAYYNERLLEDIIFTLLNDSQPRNIVLKTTNLELLMQALSDGYCVTLTDDLRASTTENGPFIFLPIEDTIELKLGAFYTLKADVLPEVTEIIHFIKGYLKNSYDTKYLSFN